MRIRTVLGFAVLGIVSLACSGGDGPVDPTPVMCSYPGLTHLKKSDPLCVPPPLPPNPTLDITLNSSTGIVGDTIGGMATPSNNLTCTLTATGAEIISGSNCGPFKAVLKVVGTATVSGSATGASGTQTALVSKNITVLPKPDVATITFTGKIILLNAQPGDTPSGWNVSVQVAGEEKVSIFTGGDGSYSLPPVKDGPVREAVFTLVPPSGSRYFPQYLATSTSYVSVNMKWPAIPKCWVIQAGIYAGQCIDVIFAHLFGDALSHFLGVSQVFPKGQTAQGFGYYSFTTWARTDDLPVRVAFDRTRTTSPLSSEDSASFWRRAVEINIVMGREYIIPSTYDEVISKKRGVLVYVDSSLGSGGFGVIPGVLSSPADMVTNKAPVIADFIIKDHIWFTNPDIDTYFPTLVRHELLHTLGLGHTTQWNSIMHPSNASLTLVPKDAAYLEMITEMGYTQKDNFTLLGFAESYNCDRVITQGLPPSTSFTLP
jgi:hypothetical protein